MKHTPHRTIRLIALVIAVGLLLAACGGENEVGSGVKLDGDGKGGAYRDEATTTSSTTSTTVATTTTAAKQTATTARAQTTTTVAAAVVIKIQDDEQGIAFDPPQVRVKPGSVVEWKYVGTKTPRQIKAENGAFRSPPIPPGGSWKWTANKVGVHNYEDETRPYAVAGKIQVG